MNSYLGKFLHIYWRIHLAAFLIIGCSALLLAALRLLFGPLNMEIVWFALGTVGVLQTIVTFHGICRPGLPRRLMFPKFENYSS